MPTQTTLPFDQSHPTQIILLKDGAFWHAHEQSAYLFTRHFWPELKVNGGYVKSVGREVYYVGFPNGSLQKVLEKIPAVGESFLKEQGVNKIIIANVPHVEGFGEWRRSLTPSRRQVGEQMQSCYEKVPLYKAVYLYFQMVNLTRHFPEDVRGVVGDGIIREGLELNNLIYCLLKLEKPNVGAGLKPAPTGTPMDDTKQIINQINERIESLRDLLRTSFDMKLYNEERYAAVSGAIESICNQLQEWQKKCEQG
jgi:hypothetical protein